MPLSRGLARNTTVALLSFRIVIPKVKNQSNNTLTSNRSFSTLIIRDRDLLISREIADFTRIQVRMCSRIMVAYPSSFSGTSNALVYSNITLEAIDR